MERRGHTVAYVCYLDAVVAAASRTSDPATEAVLTALAESAAGGAVMKRGQNIGGPLLETIKAIGRELTAGGNADRGARLLANLVRRVQTADEIEVLCRQVPLTSHYLTLLSGYRFRELQARVHVILSSESAERKQPSATPEAPFDIVRADHFSLMTGTAVQEVAQRIVAVAEHRDDQAPLVRARHTGGGQC